MFKYILLFLITLSIFSCNEKPTLWPENNSEIEAKFYKLNVSDTSKILSSEGSVFKILNLSDSIVTKTDTVKYVNPDPIAVKYFSDFQLKTVKYYSSNPKIREFYTFDHEAVKLVGICTGDSIQSYSKFDNPLIIIPAIGIKSDSSIAIKHNWNLKKSEFKKGTKTKTKIRVIKTGKIIIDGQNDDFMLLELVLTSDAKVAFGEKEFIVPDAIYLKSQLLFSKKKGLLYEWSVKSQQLKADPNNPNNQLLKNNLFIELIKYNTLNH